MAKLWALLACVSVTPAVSAAVYAIEVPAKIQRCERNSFGQVISCRWVPGVNQSSCVHLQSNRKLFVTAAHTLENATGTPEIVAHWGAPGEKRYPARVIGTYDDIALLEADTSDDFSGHTFTNGSLGMEVLVERRVPEFKATRAYLRKTSARTDKTEHEYMVPLHMPQGSSGGPVLDARTKRLVGIINASGRQSGTFYTPSRYVAELMKRVVDERPPASPPPDDVADPPTVARSACGCGNPKCRCKHTHPDLVARIDQLAKRLTDLEGSPPPRGPVKVDTARLKELIEQYVRENREVLRGERGDVGPAGAAGRDGRDGKDALDIVLSEAQVQRIIAAIKSTGLKPGRYRIPIRVKPDNGGNE